MTITNSNDSDTKRDKVFPIPKRIHLILFIAAFILAVVFYGALSKSIHSHYVDALKSAQVICSFLSNYGESTHYACDQTITESKMDSESSNTAQYAVTKEPKPIIDKTVFDKTLLPRDFSSMMVAAEMIKEKDVEDPNKILMINKSGAAAWISNTVIDTKIGQSNLSNIIISGLFKNSLANNETACGGIKPLYEMNEAERVKYPEHASEVYGTISTLQSLIILYEKMGEKLGNPPSPTNDRGTQGNNCYQPVSEQVEYYTDELIDALSGKTPRLYEFYTTNKPVATVKIIKHAMVEPWGHYDMMFLAPTADNDPSHFYMNEYKLERSTSSTYETVQDDMIINDLPWFKKDPTQFYDALFSLSHLWINEVYRDAEVKKWRFAYQALRGPIQFALIVLIVYIFLILVWRLIASSMGKKLPLEHNLLIPTAVCGNLNDIEQQTLDSRRFIDQLISTLPLIGLFGTVVGILLGLPNAAAAITAKGHGAATAVNELFEQLGLAFSTTAIAVLGVILLEIMWELIQTKEDHTIWQIDKNGDGYNGGQ